MTQQKARRLVAVISTVALTLISLTGFASAANAASESKTLVLKGFGSNSSVLTSGMKKQLRSFISENDNLGFISCVGYADRPGSQSANNNLGKKRATTSCDFASKRFPGLVVSKTKGKWDSSRSGSDVRRVVITLSDSSQKQVTTYFEYQGGERGLASIKSALGEKITLPSPVRQGYEFLGWFTQQYNGKKIGDAGDSYSPTKTRILWAQWFIPATNNVEPAGCSTDPFVESLGGKSLTYKQVEAGTFDEGGYMVLPGIAPAIDGVEKVAGDMFDFFAANLEGFSDEVVNECFSLAIKYDGTTVYSESGNSEDNTFAAPGFFAPNDGEPIPGHEVGDIYVGAENGYLSVFLRFLGPNAPANLGDLTLTITWGETDYVFTGGAASLPEEE